MKTPCLQFRKRPVEVEAYQITPATRADNSGWPGWLHAAWQAERHEPSSVSPVDYPNSDGTDHLVIHTLEGMMLVAWGDWIVRGVDGELYPCKDSIFRKTYDPVVVDD